MALVKLIARVKLRYGGKSLVDGDEFEATEKDAKVLTAINKAKFSERAKYQTRMMSAALEPEPVVVQPAAVVAEPPRPKTLTLPKKTYKTA